MGGLPGEEDGPFPGVGLRRVISVSEERRYEDCRRALRQQLVLVSLGTDEKDAARIFGECAQTGQIEALFTIGHRTLYVLHSSGIPLAVPPNPAGRS
jgi:hypothetical protein